MERLQFHLLPIRDWNRATAISPWLHLILQFHLLPIRDWNYRQTDWWATKADCNFTYSLLGIETQEAALALRGGDCNFTYSLLGIETLLK